jgi:hypothetical protein
MASAIHLSPHRYWLSGSGVASPPLTPAVAPDQVISVTERATAIPLLHQPLLAGDEADAAAGIVHGAGVEVEAGAWFKFYSCVYVWLWLLDFAALPPTSLDLL